MNKNKAFTLVELLAVIAILSIILVMFVPNLLNSINENKEKALNKIYDLIETGTRNYVIDYSISTPTRIELEDLCKASYIECPIINPKTDEELAGYIYVNDDYYYSEVTETSITIELNGGDIARTFESSYEPGTVIELSTPTKGENEFKGWKVVKGNSGIRDNKLIIGTTESIIWAEWGIKELVKLTLDLDGGSLSNKPETEYLQGTNITLENPTKAGYTFTGWEVTEGNSVVSGSTLTMGTQETTIKAKWKVNTYTVTLDANGGTLENANIIVRYNDEYGILPIPQKEGYVFTGWYTELDGVIRIDEDTIVTNMSNHTLYAGWLYSEFTYTGNEETFTIPISGYYRLDAWGAQGGYAKSSTYRGGYGGYSTGLTYLEEGTILYINVGGKGTNGTKYATEYLGGYNGGGYGTSTDEYYAAGGGGATHIAKVSGLLSTLSSQKENILIVAGGGGGAGCWDATAYGYGGEGGGYIGNDGSSIQHNDAGTVGTGGTQTSGSAFGKGANSTVGPGGGAGLYGGKSSGTYSGSGGGSGYVEGLINGQTYGYNGSVSETATSYQSKKGAGYVKITYVSKTYNSGTMLLQGDSVTFDKPTYYELDIKVSGYYQLEAWGAQGGFAKSSTYRGGYGSYSTGVSYLEAGTKLYIYVGGKGQNGYYAGQSTAGGYNGGGNGKSTVDYYVGGGGGATHIATTSGLLSTLSSQKGNILIVAGGGGGGAYWDSENYGSGGEAGGYKGNDGTMNDGSDAEKVGTGGTQTAGSAFGKEQQVQQGQAVAQVYMVENQVQHIVVQVEVQDI